VADHLAIDPRAAGLRGRAGASNGRLQVAPPSIEELK